MKMRHRCLGIIAAGALVAGMTACAGTDRDAGSDGNQTVRIQGIENMTGLDRYAVNGIGQDSIAMLWGDMLVSTDHRGTYTAGLVEDWEWSEDELSVELTVRQGVTFSNGDELTSEDVAFTIARLKDPELPNAGAWAVVDTVETPDEHTVIVNFSAPMPVFLNLASRTPGLNAAAYAEDPEGYFDAPIGTGPYNVVSFNGPTGTVKLEQKDDWWGWTDDNRSNVTTIEYSYVPADQSRVSALQAGEVEIVQKLPVGDSDRIAAEGFVIDKYNELSHVYFGLRSGEGDPFESPQLREALSLAIDRESLVNDLLGGGRVSTWPSMPDTIGFRDGDGYAFDPEAAARLVVESGYDGAELNFILPNGLFAQGQEVAEAIQAMAGAVGINLAVVSLETATMQEHISAGSYDIYMNAFTMVNADSFTQITSLIGRDRFNTGFVNPELTALTQEIAVTVDQTTRDDLTAEAYQIIMDSFAPTIFLYEPLGVTASVESVTGLIPFPDGVADFRFLTKS